MMWKNIFHPVRSFYNFNMSCSIWTFFPLEIIVNIISWHTVYAHLTHLRNQCNAYAAMLSLNMNYLISNVSYTKGITLKTLSPQYSQWSQNEWHMGIIWRALYFICLTVIVTSNTGRQIQNYTPSVSWHIADIKLLNKKINPFSSV